MLYIGEAAAIITSITFAINSGLFTVAGTIVAILGIAVLFLV